MKQRSDRCLLIISLTLCVMVFLLFFCPNSYAEEKITSGRRLWDNIMLWVNFGILAFLFMKYAKKPLLTFLSGERLKVEDNINEVKGRHSDLKTGMEKENKRLDGIDDYLKKIREDVIEMGRRERDKIIEQGEITAGRMIKDAETYSNNRILTAKKALSDEMVDIAVSIVAGKLEKEISEDDNAKLISQFVTNLDASKVHFN